MTYKNERSWSYQVDQQLRKFFKLIEIGYKIKNEGNIYILQIFSFFVAYYIRKNREVYLIWL